MNSSHSMPGRLAGLLLMASLLAMPARADLIHVVATGDFNNVEGATQLLPGAAFSNDWRIELTVSDAVADSVPGNAATGVYTGALQSLQLTLGSEVYGLWPNSYVLVLNDSGGSTDFWIASTSEVPPVAGAARQTYDEIRLVLTDNNPQGGPAPAFASDALVAPPAPYDWFLAAMNYVVRDAAGAQLAVATATVSSIDVQVTAVPLPATAGLLLSGLVPACFAMARRRLSQAGQAGSPGDLRT